MNEGKLSNRDLKELVLDRIQSTRPEVVLGAAIGEDCAAVKVDDAVVLSTDPITAADSSEGLLALHVNANDIASAGAVPFAALVTLMAPPTTSRENLARLVSELMDAAASMEIDVIGGHTEVTAAVVRPVVSLTMLGRPAVPGRILSTAGMKDGDTLVMTKYAGIEGTLILAQDHERQLEDLLSGPHAGMLDLLRSFLSVVPEGIIGARDGHVSAMHDITEGGVIGAVQEMSDASGVGVELDLGDVPVLPITRDICRQFHVDPHRLMSSGSMLMAVSPGSHVMEDLAAAGIPATIIGRTRAVPGVVDRHSGLPLARQAMDDMYRIKESE